MRVLAAVLAAVAVAAPQRPVPGEKKTMATMAQSGPEVLIQKGAYRPQPVTVDARPLQDGAAATRQNATADGAAYDHPWGNPAQNGRLAVTLPSGTWRQHWKTELAANVQPVHVLAGGNRLLVSGGGFWQLLDTTGKSIGEGSCGPADPSLDAARGLFYVAARTGYLEARNLSDGQIHFQELLPHSEEYLRPLIAGRGDNLVIVSQETPQLSPGGVVRPNLVSVQVQRLHSPLEVDSGGMGRLAGLQTLQIKTGVIAAAVAREAIFAAVPKRLFLIAMDLGIRTAYEADFEPLLMSVDEGGYIYLLVRVPSGQQVWGISPGGTRFATIALDTAHETPIQPPVIGYDHRIYSVNPHQVLAVDPDGTTAWDVVAPARIAGVGVTADGQLVASAADQVIAFGHDGKHHAIVTITGETLQTPPVIVPGGELYVAGERHLYCFGR